MNRVIEYTTPNNINDVSTEVDTWLKDNDALLLQVNPELNKVFKDIDHERMR